MTHDSEWTDWIPHVAGDPCPIPDAKAGEYQLRSRGEPVDRFNHVSVSATWWAWGEDEDGTITHYRLRLRKPSPDWRGIAEELARALIVLRRQALQSDVNSPYNEWGQEALNETAAALASYREVNK